SPYPEHTPPRTSSLSLHDALPISRDVGRARHVAHRTDHANDGQRVHCGGWTVDSVLSSAAAGGSAVIVANCSLHIPASNPGESGRNRHHPERGARPCRRRTLTRRTS